eukprot:7780877-Ditylum_brightwellii.AAC.1
MEVKQAKQVWSKLLALLSSSTMFGDTGWLGRFHNSVVNLKKVPSMSLLTMSWKLASHLAIAVLLSHLRKQQCHHP